MSPSSAADSGPVQRPSPPQGELLELASVAHVLGAEAQAETGEPHASQTADPRDQGAITVCFAMEHRPGEDHTIDIPRQYELWRDFRPPGWPGPLLSWTTQRRKHTSR